MSIELANIARGAAKHSEQALTELAELKAAVLVLQERVTILEERERRRGGRPLKEERAAA